MGNMGASISPSLQAERQRADRTSKPLDRSRMWTAVAPTANHPHLRGQIVIHTPPPTATASKNLFLVVFC